MSVESKIMVDPKTKEEIQTYSGFSWPAFLIAPIWCLIKGLYIQGIIFILISLTGWGIIGWVIAGILGNGWYLESLNKKNYIEKGTKVVEKNDDYSKEKTQEKESEISKIKELKELLDSGIISIEEYENKKKELLNRL
jgi:hypothetical protein